MWTLFGRGLQYARILPIKPSPISISSTSDVCGVRLDSYPVVSILTAAGLPRIAGRCGGSNDVGQMDSASETHRPVEGNNPLGWAAKKKLPIGQAAVV